jgi:hypothetical protein
VLARGGPPSLFKRFFKPTRLFQRKSIDPGASTTPETTATLKEKAHEIAANAKIGCASPATVSSVPALTEDSQQAANQS